MKNAITWFEIPTLDLDRAVRFYSDIFGYEINIDSSMGMKMGMFPYDQMNGVGGCLLYDENIKPSVEGTTVYLFVGDKLDEVIPRIEKFGGKIILPKMKVSDEIGFII